MAQRAEIEITCDRVAPGHGGEVESLDMTLGGTEYQIDLCVKHRKPYSDLLEMITVDGRRVGTRGRQQPAAGKQPGSPPRVRPASPPGVGSSRSRDQMGRA